MIELKTEPTLDEEVRDVPTETNDSIMKWKSKSMENQNRIIHYAFASLFFFSNQLSSGNHKSTVGCIRRQTHVGCGGDEAMTPD